MIKGTTERVTGRREEIMNACQRLYRMMSFREITIKEIGAELPFSRPTIYNYFETKEEIFLGLFEREYRLWTIDLGAIEPNAGALAEQIAQTLEPRALMLRLLAVNLYDMEENSRIERLVEFKQAYRASVETFDWLLQSAFPQWTEETRRETLVAAFQFLHGVYPYAHATEKQIEAMEKAGVRYDQKSIYELSLVGLSKILR